MKLKIQLFFLYLFVLQFNTVLGANQVVTSNADSGPGSLRQAIIDVGSGETITFNLSAGNETIILTSDELLIDKSMTIDGANAAGSGVRVTVQVPVPGTTQYRVFHIQVAGTVTISNLNMKGGVNQDIMTGGGVILSEDGSGGGNVTLNLNSVVVENGKSGGGLAAGGGVCYDGNLTVQNSLFQNNGSTNSAESGNGGGISSGVNAVNASILNSTFKNNSSIGGGGIAVDPGTATISGCTFENNTAGQNDVLEFGGGILASSQGNNILIENSTFYNNNSSGEGGAIRVINGAIVTINSCTIFNNHANGEPGVPMAGGGIAITNTGATGSGPNSVIILKNSIIYGNTSSQNFNNDIAYLSGTFTNQGYNIYRDANISTGPGDYNGSFSNVFGTGQSTQTLANNGGPTQTFKILAGSLAINNGQTALTIDQRGYTRGTPTTIGAFAYEGTVVTPPSTTAAGVSNGSLWLKADAGTTTSGSNLTDWTDQLNVNTFTKSGALNIGYVPNSINFNPVVSINNTQANTQLPNAYFAGNTSITAVEAFAVMRKTDPNCGTLVGSSVHQANYGMAIFSGESNNQMWVGNGVNNTYQHFVNTGLTTGNATLLNFDVSPTSTPFTIGSLNGLSQTIIPGSGGDFSSLTFTPWIGGTNNNSAVDGWKHFKGEVAEIILYSTSLSATDKLKVQSYLAIKYGVTLDQSVVNYINNANTSIWNNTTYWNDVFGIGKDVASGLNQIQSNSINTGSGDGTGQSGKGNIVLSNPSSLNDGDFLLIGHDNAALTEQSTEVPTAGQLRIAREWLVKHTGDAGTVDLSFDILGLTVTGTTAADFKLLIDADGDFSSGATVVNATSLTGTKVVFTGVTLPNSSYFTFVTAKDSTLSLYSPNSKNRKIELFPNPANQIVNIKNSSKMSIEKAIVSDLHGRIIKKFILNTDSENISLDISKLTKSNYLITIYTVDGIKTLKLIVD